MPLFDYVCSRCETRSDNVYVKHWSDEVKCGCGAVMNKIPSFPTPHVFPAEGVFLEHVSAEGKRFFSKQEMRDYAREHDIEIGYLD